MVIRNIFLFIFLMSALMQPVVAQKNDCIFKSPLLTIDFGTEKNSPDINFSYLPNYRRVSTSCPMDGHYSYSSYTQHCNGDDWFTLNEDHTPGDEEGKMMVVNASETGGVFFTATLDGLTENTRYEFAACMMNLCRFGGNCPVLPPNILIMLKTPAGRLVGEFQTGLLPQGYEPDWKRYAGLFNTAAKETTLLLIMQDVTIGGCGNDFALDDITIRECLKPQPPVTEKPQTFSPPTKKTQAISKPLVKKETTKQPEIKNIAKVSIIEKIVRDSSINNKLIPNQKNVIIPVPQILLSRTNPIIKQFTVDAGEIQINLYDNGEIDGDTVSVYHNNELIVSRARLSQKPITFRITVDAGHPHQELIMVANNLGSIPPNTSVMIITANEKRFQVFISSSEQINAKVVFDMKH